MDNTQSMYIGIGLIVIVVIVIAYFYFASGAITGRYVQIRSAATGCFNAASLQVMSNGVDVALHKTGVMSSPYEPGNQFPIANLTDGNPSTFAHTSCNDIGIMNIDLAAAYPIDSIVLLNRADCCGNRLTGAVVEVFDAANKLVWTSDKLKNKEGTTVYQSGTPFAKYTFTLPGTTVVAA